MSWIRSSKGITLLAVLALSVAAAGTVTAVSVTSDAPAEAQVGETVSITTSLSDVYEDAENWQLNGETALEDVSGWEVTKVTPSGETNTTQFENASFDVPVQSSENIDHINVTVTGTVPSVEQYSYDPPQTFDAVTLTRLNDNQATDITTIDVHHYTSDSQASRDVLDEAATAVNDSDSEDAQSELDNAIASFNDGSFGPAESNAQDAIDAAESAESSQQTMQLVLYGVGAIVVIALIGGGIYYYKSQQDDYDKLR